MVDDGSVGYGLVGQIPDGCGKLGAVEASNKLNTSVEACMSSETSTSYALQCQVCSGVLGQTGAHVLSSSYPFRALSRSLRRRGSAEAALYRGPRGVGGGDLNIPDLGNRVRSRCTISLTSRDSILTALPDSVRVYSSHGGTSWRRLGLGQGRSLKGRKLALGL
jgi:hypothetical protein